MCKMYVYNIPPLFIGADRGSVCQCVHTQIYPGLNGLQVNRYTFWAGPTPYIVPSWEGGSLLEGLNHYLDESSSYIL